MTLHEVEHGPALVVSLVTVAAVVYDCDFVKDASGAVKLADGVITEDEEERVLNEAEEPILRVKEAEDSASVVAEEDEDEEKAVLYVDDDKEEEEEVLKVDEDDEEATSRVGVGAGPPTSCPRPQGMASPSG